MTETDLNAPAIETTCCIVGGGPAGVMLGLLLARAGIDVTVLEKYADFFRDFRGDTIHPSTLELMKELGLLDALLKQPHDEARELHGVIGGTELVMADFSHLPTAAKFIAFMPQWDFLNFLAAAGRRYPAFHLKMHTEAYDLIEESGSIVGVKAHAPQGDISIRAHLTVAADGRHSALRDRAGFAVQNLGAPMDVLWLRLSRQASDPEHSLGRVLAGLFFITINRGDYWQCAFVIPKGSFDTTKQQGMEAFRAQVVSAAPYFVDRVAELKSFDDVKLLTVALDRLPLWHKPGLLFIGDAAHAMSPIGGVGINLAVQDAVATANLLYAVLAAETVTDADLAKVQARREWPVRVTQRIQLAIQNRLISPVLASNRQSAVRLPLALRLLKAWPLLQRIPARVIGMGVRPEHVRTPEAPPN